MKALNERIITVGHFTWSRAVLLQIILQDKGIQCFIVPREAMLSRGWVDIRVSEKDVEKSLKIIASSQADTGKAKEHALHKIRTIRRIMIPVDFSDISFNACRFGVTLAEKFKAEIKLVHVFYNPNIDVSPYADHYSYQIKLVENLREIEKSARENMLRLEHKIRVWCIKENHPDVKITSKLINGFGIDELLDFSKKYRPALMVMGTRGLTSDNYKAFGRFVSRVIENIDIPVLALPSGKINGISEIKSLVYASDLDPADIDAINQLIGLLSPFKIKLHCLHICLIEKKAWDKVKLEELQKHLNSEYKGVDIHFANLVSDNMVNGLQTYMRDNQIDAIAVTTHKRGMLDKLFIPSVSQKIYSETGKPLLVFHA
jgi:nucleotide-binding universal stress UspA family protein